MSNTKIKYVKVHGFTGRGANAKEAKQDAIRQIESLNQGHWEPTIVEWRGHSVLVFRGLNGWQSTFLRSRQRSGGEDGLVVREAVFPRRKQDDASKVEGSSRRNRAEPFE